MAAIASRPCGSFIVEFWALRDEAVGHIVTVKYFARRVKDKPRHAQFKDFRPEFDR